jgi:hypothetical protein
MNRRAVIVLVVAAASLLGLTACSAAAPTSAPTRAAGTGAPTGGGGQRPGVSGTIAAASDGLLQVQSTSTQTAVSYTSSTTIRQQVTGTLADVTAGVCIVATSAASGSPATSVRISPSTDGGCAGGFGGRGGGASAGPRPTARPTPDASHRAGGGAGAGRFSGAFATGVVSQVSGDTITLQSAQGSDSTVTVGSSTVFTTTQTATASALAVGQCVTAQGTADQSGGFAATALTVSAPVGGTCTGGFGGGRRGGGSSSAGGAS